MKLNICIQKIKSLISNFHLFLLVYILVVVLVYFAFIFLPELIFTTKLGVPASTYILLSASSIILTTWGGRISRYIRHLFIDGQQKTQEVKIVDQRKIRFLLIFIYFIAIIIFTLASLLSYPIFDIEKMDYSIIQSFATYISYDRLVRNYPTIKSNNSNEDNDDL